jgi:hypothetical protein
MSVEKLIEHFSAIEAACCINVIKLEGIKVFIERCRKADKVVLS